MARLLPLLALLLLACGSDVAPFRWTTGSREYDCVVRDRIAGGSRMQTLTIKTEGETFQRDGGELLAIAMMELPESNDSLLVTQWPAGANTYELAVYQMVNGKVREVLSAVTGTTELAFLDLGDDGTYDVVTYERGAEGGMSRGKRYVYTWRDGRFVRSEATTIAAR
jgi:hypothetical protein